jgi:hypothetical protein
MPIACGGGGGGGGGDGETTVAASSTQVGQAVLVAASAIDATGAAIDTGTGAVSGSSVATSSVEAAAMGTGGVMPSAHEHFAGMGSGMGSLNLAAESCDGSGSGTVATHMEWTDLNPDTLCVDGLDATFSLDDCTVAAGHMTVTSEGTNHTVTFNADGSIDVAPTGGEPVHLAGPAVTDFCDL